MAELNELVRKNILNLAPYSCARDEFKGKEGIFLDANENPFGTLNRYPDPYQRDLKEAIAAFRNISADNIFLGNGSDEIIDICFRVFCNPGFDKVLLFPPTYGMYEVSASINDAIILKVPLMADFQIDIEKVKPLLSDEKLKLIFICSPNNPTGNAMNIEDIEFLIKNFKGIVVVDEAYIDFSDKHSVAGFVDKYENLIVMQTFSKALGLAAARIGIAITNRSILQYFNKVKPPYNISTINQLAALKKISDTDILKSDVDIIRQEKIRLVSELSTMKITKKIYPSDANFVLVEVADADKTYNNLISRSIVTRNRNSVVNNCLRITIGKKSENDDLLRELRGMTDSI